MTISVILFPIHITAQTLDSLTYESNSIGQKLPHFKVGQGASQIVPSIADNNILFVVNTGSGFKGDTVSIIDLESMKVSNIPVGRKAGALTFNLQDDNLYVANCGSDTISVIDVFNHSIIKEIRVGSCPTDIVWKTDKIYVPNLLSKTISVINTTDYSIIKEIPVGKYPRDIELDSYTNILYVANSRNGTFSGTEGLVSVINATDYSIIKEIPVGKDPRLITTFGDVLYVTNSGSGTVSVINATDYSIIKEIRVGENPSDVGRVVDQEISGNYIIREDFLYVTNSGSGTVSVINATDYSIIKEIRVGENPSDIEVLNGMVTADVAYPSIAYVANSDSGTVIAIHGKTHNLLAGISFDVNPFHAGRIMCNNITVPTNQYFFADLSTKCTAQANKGFQFSSWIEELTNNSSRTVNATTASDSPVDLLLNTLGIDTRDKLELLTVTKFGKFVANFKEVPPAIPREIWLSLFAISLSVIIPSILRWYNGWRQRRHFYRYMKELPSKHKEKLDLKAVNDEISELYAKGKINESQHKILNEKASGYYNND